VETRFKNAIIIDTNVRQETHYLDRPRDIIFAKGTKHAFARVGSDEYSINYDSTFQRLRNKRFTAYADTYSHMTFVEPEPFFNDLKGELFLQKPEFVGSDSVYTLGYSTPRYTNKSIQFNKADYSIRNITEVIYDKLNKGFQVKHIEFSQVRELTSSEENELNEMLALIKDPSKEDSFTPKEEETPEFIERSLLETYLKPLTSRAIESIEGKTIFLDFFYQGCYPCVKSHPYVNDLYKSKNQTLL